MVEDPIILFRLADRIRLPTTTMKFPRSVTESILECLQDAKTANATGSTGAVVRSLAQSGVAASPNSDVANGAGHILLADDDTGFRDFLANLFRGAGYRVTCASHGEGAWDALCADRFDVLVADHAMPKITGLDLIRRLRVGPLCSLPCILISGAIPWEQRDLLDLLVPGMAMAKPFSFLEMLTCVRTLLPPTRLAPTRPLLGLAHEAEAGKPVQTSAAWKADAGGRQPKGRLVRAG